MNIFGKIRDTKNDFDIQMETLNKNISKFIRK